MLKVGAADVSAFLGQQQRRARTNTRTGSCHQSDAIIKLYHV
jgi:hypothetical protein